MLFKDQPYTNGKTATSVPQISHLIMLDVINLLYDVPLVEFGNKSIYLFIYTYIFSVVMEGILWHTAGN